METGPFVAVGTFVILIVFAVVGAVLWLGHVEFGRDLQTYYIFFRGSVAGLTRGSALNTTGSGRARDRYSR